MAEIQAEELEGVADLRVAIRRFLAATNEVTSAHGLTPAQYDLLALLHRPDQAEVTATSIADALCLSRSATTELLTRAAKAGLITREGSDDDMRIKRLSSTREGTKRFTAAVRELRSDRIRLLKLLRRAATSAPSPSTTL